ncbi:3D domain-containing protein [Brevibacillus laterosporus]|uniref:3D domain-containing protein n=1 Tax=Brevibacillus laterosporus TaxID=1465 RepID=UPI0026555E57|nr:3D domain-containing protein [Brevibacillus laterosporus]MDN9012878.1 hypothetical protein [Brevibacillus laterosporus]MDO0943955.1 hypothetical protein [Brevibacillus laterosporus]
MKKRKITTILVGIALCAAIPASVFAWDYKFKATAYWNTKKTIHTCAKGGRAVKAGDIAVSNQKGDILLGSTVEISGAINPKTGKWETFTAYACDTGSAITKGRIDIFYPQGDPYEKIDKRWDNPYVKVKLIKGP